jgi:hypothetical protein
MSSPSICTNSHRIPRSALVPRLVSSDLAEDVICIPTSYIIQQDNSHVHNFNVLYNFDQFVTLARFSKKIEPPIIDRARNPGSNLIFWPLCDAWLMNWSKLYSITCSPPKTHIHIAPTSATLTLSCLLLYNFYEQIQPPISAHLEVNRFYGAAFDHTGLGRSRCIENAKIYLKL